MIKKIKVQTNVKKKKSSLLEQKIERKLQILFNFERLLSTFFNLSFNYCDNKMLIY